MRVLQKLTTEEGDLFLLKAGCGDPTKGEDDLVITKNGEKVWGTNSLGDDFAYTNGRRMIYVVARTPVRDTAPEPKPTQKSRLLNHLSKGRSITRLEAWSELGILELAARIGELMNDGHDIAVEYLPVKNRFGETVRIAKYRLAHAS